MSAPAFEGQPMTKREVLIARAAFERGLVQPLRAGMESGALIDAAFPLPKVTRPRVLSDPENGRHGPDSFYSWSYFDNAMRFRWESGGTQWKIATGATENMLLTPTPERVAVWANLLANPTEEVEA